MRFLFLYENRSIYQENTIRILKYNEHEQEVDFYE